MSPYITWGLADQFENLTLTGSGNINGYGNGAANVITGNGGANLLRGRRRATTRSYGGNGNDTLYRHGGQRQRSTARAATTTIEDGVGTNTLNGGGGDDCIVVHRRCGELTPNGGTGTDLL